MAASLSRHAPPKASAMIESLRGLGYTTATALADIIDNSIAADADRVDITFIWQGPGSIISILDNGNGMTEGKLDKGMRLDEISPLENRKMTDLGRFGLGLKTASFSQCRRLTVASRKNNEVSCLRWDLDIIATSNDDGWYLLEGAHKESEKLLSPLNNYNTGCLVLWEVLDRIITPGFGEQDFLDLIDRIERYLAMIFHRLLEGNNRSGLKIYINNKSVSPWNPFLIGHPAKPWNSPEVRFPSADGVVMECHVLPHKDGLTESEFQSAAGPEGWTAQQGFYVYRNKRLLLAGTWLGLGQGRAWIKDEAHRLARIRLDIPNSADADWKIDIRKSVARPPVNLRPWLTRYAEDTRRRARRVFAHRGKLSTGIRGQPVVAAWKTEHFSGGVRYRIDPDHPAVMSVLEDAGSLLPQIKAMFRVIEETIPVQRIWIDTAENRETPRTNFNGKGYEKYAGDAGYLQNQGFYVYRNHRLIIKSTWFRLIPKEELTKLLRVRIDIPNTLDHLWKIDVKKANASPPESIRKQLKQIIHDIQDQGKQVYKQKGKRLKDSVKVPAWNRTAAAGKIVYGVNKTHPLITQLEEKLQPEQRGQLKDLLLMLESCFPTELFYSDVARKPEELEKPAFDTEHFFSSS